MVHVIAKEQLNNGNLFQGAKYGEVPVSFFWVEAQPGYGPRLHVHPYEEIFVIQEGQATFTIGEDTLEVTGGHIVVAPAGVPHTFVNSGQGLLRSVNIHPSQQVIQQWLEH
jgi:mannose-6-phosphate isomerase-like protein (cupin superfamily)